MLSGAKKIPPFRANDEDLNRMPAPASDAQTSRLEHVRRMFLLGGLLTVPALLLAGCSSPGDDRPVAVDLIGRPVQLAEPLKHSNSPAGKAMLGAVAQGLVSFDARGEIVDALAESWIVEDGGESYIFRLKRLNWPDGGRVKADQVANLLRERFRANGLWAAGLRPEIKAMTDRVIEIRFETSLPAFLQLIAQPQFGIMEHGKGTGPYRTSKEPDGTMLTPAPMLSDSDTATEEERPSGAELRSIRANRAAVALVRFRRGSTDLVLGGRFQHLLLVPAANISVNDLRIDPVEGLLGLAVTSESDFLSQAPNRDALARVIDRARLAVSLGMSGWRTSNRLLPGALDLGRDPSTPGWAEQSQLDRLAVARQQIERWSAVNGPPPVLKVALPDGPGASVLFMQLAHDFGQLGIKIDRVDMGSTADLQLIDEVAPFDSALWYLSRVDCAAGVSCDPRASALLAQARQAPDLNEKTRLMSEAETLITANSGYIPLGQPIRWALASKRLTGVQPSPRGIHPLNRLFAITN